MKNHITYKNYHVYKENQYSSWIYIHDSYNGCYQGYENDIDCGQGKTAAECISNIDYFQEKLQTRKNKNEWEENYFDNKERLQNVQGY